MNTAPTQPDPSRLDAAETKMGFPVFPGNTNHYHTLFGGTRWCRTKVVTVRSSEIDFRHPVPEGTIVELVGRVVETGRTSLTVRVEMYTEPMDRHERRLACRGSFVLVALDDSDQPAAVPPLR